MKSTLDKKKRLRVISPTGVVHAVEGSQALEHNTTCNYVNITKWHGMDNYHYWKLTEKPVTCKNCLKILGLYQWVGNHKTVMMPVRVPSSDHCWDGHHACGKFDNSEGAPSCNLGFYDLKYDESHTVPKPKKCKELK